MYVLSPQNCLLFSMWQRSVWRHLRGSSDLANVFAPVRRLKSIVRSPRRILTEREAEAETRPGANEVSYHPSDLVSDQASRPALLNNGPRSGIPRSVKELEPFMGEPYKKTRVKRLDKLDKTANMNFVQLLAKLRTKKYRDKTRQVLLEGKRLIADGLLAGCRLQTLIYSDPKQLEHLPLVEDEGERILIDKARMATWSLLEAPPGVMAVVDRPDNDYLLREDVGIHRIPLTVVVDGVREPTNMGAIIRTLGAAGCERLLLTKGTCDPWEEKVLRSGMGAHFRVPLFSGIQWPELINYVPETVRVFLADCNSFEVVKEAASYVQDDTNPIRLNAPDDADEFGTGSTEVKLIRHQDGTVVQIEPELRRPKLPPTEHHTLPIFEYHEPSYFGHEDENCHCLVIIGGETSSLSAAAYQFAHMHSGCKVHISMCNGVNSLNVSTALGVIAFEIQRQYRKRVPLKEKDSANAIQSENIGLLASDSQDAVQR